MMQEVARGQPNGLAAFDNGADDVGSQEGITDCLAHAVRWDGVFGGNLLIGTVKLRSRARSGPLDNGARAHRVANILGSDRP